MFRKYFLILLTCVSLCLVCSNCFMNENNIRLPQQTEPPKEPILRIETGMHTAAITRIAVDRAERILVTASLDKTVRVWDLKTGNLKRILRAPIGKDAYEGKLYCAAISPDSKIVAVGGWTGFEWDTANFIYLFSSDTGEMLHRITGLPNVINHLSFSKEGQYLAATLGAGGLRVYETENWSLKAEDKDYGSASYGADFDADGRLITTCFDGFIRLYDSNFKLIAKKTVQSGKQPASVSFSRDNKEIAVGFYDSTNVNVLSIKDLSFLYAPNTTGVDNGNLVSVAWSSEGGFLFAGGMYNDEKGTCPIRRWSNHGRGDYIDLAAANSTITQILPLAKDKMVFGSGEPAFSIFDTRGVKTLFKRHDIADYRRVFKEGFLISMDGGTVRFSFEKRDKSPALFSVYSRTLNSLSNAKNREKLFSPIMSVKGLNITDWENVYSTKLNGNALKLEDHERSRSLAISPDEQSFILGTESCIRCFDRQGNQKWGKDIPVAAWGVNISGNGKIVIAALADGTIRWYRMTDGEELLAFFPHKDKKRWVLWTPSGYYAASAGGDELIGWHINNGKDKAPDFFPASRFRSVYYRPDITEKILATLNEKEAIRLANEEAGKKEQRIAIQQMAPPVVTIISPKDGSDVSNTDITINYEIRTPSGEPVTETIALVDGKASKDFRIEKDGKIKIKIPKADCSVSIIAKNRYSASEASTINFLWQVKEKKVQPEEYAIIKPKLYVLALGVSNYQNPNFKLSFPAKDAEDFARILQKQRGKLYQNVIIKALKDPQKAEVEDGFDWIQKETTAKDVVMIFISGHGLNDRAGDYYYLPANANLEKIKSTCVPYSVIKSTITDLPGKTLLFIDTCHSGNVMGDYKTKSVMGDIDQIVNDLMSAENGIIVFASSTGKQTSLESKAWGNGAFTKAVVEGFDGKAANKGKGKITIAMMEAYICERVKELTEGKQTPTTAKPITITDFPIAIK